LLSKLNFLAIVIAIYCIVQLLVDVVDVGFGSVVVVDVDVVVVVVYILPHQVEIFFLGICALFMKSASLFEVEFVVVVVVVLPPLLLLLLRAMMMSLRTGRK
jgi:hypothetical protein